MRGTRWMRLIVGTAALVLVLAACSSDDNGGGSSGSTGGTTTATTGATGGGGGGGNAITISGFAFHPSSLTVSGETTVTVTNNDDVTHTFTLDDGSVDEDVPAGQSIDVTVNISASTGFHCKIHPSMTGTLDVG